MLNFKVETLECIARGEPLSAVAERICLGVEALFPDVVCSILTIDRGGTTHVLAAPSLPQDYCDLLENIAIGPNVGSCGTAAYNGRPCETSDISTDPCWNGYREPALALGFQACSSFPLVDASGLVTATFAYYFRDPRLATLEERSIVATALHLCDLALAHSMRIEQRERRATLDALTGLPNRGSFERTLVNLAGSSIGTWALYIVDVDELKVTNDTFGHGAGDRLIQEMAHRLQCLAAPDRVFRIGGDEFAIIALAPERVADPASLATDIAAKLAEPMEVNAFSLSPMATIGCTLVHSQGDEPDEAFRQADMALHHAKETAPGSFVLYKPSIRSGIVARISSIESLELALREDRISAWYQPVVEIASRRILGFEALCRMRSPNNEIIAAAAFSEATADARIASKLTTRMLRQVANDMRKWRDMGIPVCQIGVNITAPDLRGGRLPELIETLFGAEPDLLANLVLEINESIYFGKRTQQALRVITDLRARGIRIALDDFGTGYASLTHLLNMPVDIIKIDKAFIAGLPEDELSGTIVSALMAIAEKLGARITAEGIETFEQANSLANRGCMAGQGYFYARAVPAPEAARLAMLHAANKLGSAPIDVPTSAFFDARRGVA